MCSRCHDTGYMPDPNQTIDTTDAFWAGVMRRYVPCTCELGPVARDLDEAFEKATRP